MRTALVVGVTGLVGGLCLEQVLRDEAYSNVTVLTRKKLKIENQKLTQCVVDFERLNDYSEVIRADDVFCCLGTTIKSAGSADAFRKVDYSYPYQIATIALANGTTQFLMITALGANSRSSLFYNQVKGEIEQAVEALGFKSTYFIRPSLILGERKEFRRGEEILKRVITKAAILFVGPLRRYRAIHAEAIAFSMVQLALTSREGVFKVESSQLQQIYDLRSAGL